VDDVTTIKITIVAMSDVYERTVTEPGLTKLAPDTMIKRVAQSPYDVNATGDEKIKDGLVDEDNNEDKDVEENKKYTEPGPGQYATEVVVNAPTKDRRTEGNSLNHDDKQQPARHPQDDEPPALHVSSVTSMVPNNKPKKREQNRNKEEQMETQNATEDGIGGMDTKEIAEKKAAKSNIHTIQPPIEDDGDDDNEAANTTNEEFDGPAAEQANTYGEGAATDSKGDTIIEVTERNTDDYREPPTDTSGFLDEMEAEVTPRTDEAGEIPHHAALEQGAADDQPAQSDQHPSSDEEPHHTTPVPGEGDQRPSSPVGYDSIAHPSHVMSKVQQSPSLRPEQENLYRMVDRNENPHWEEKMNMTHSRTRTM
jgi:hypothetical protein